MGESTGQTDYRWRTRAAALAIAVLAGCAPRAAAPHPQLGAIETIVVIYGENRSFDNLYGMFPGAEGVADALADPARYLQRDRDGTLLPELPPVWLRNPDGTVRPDPAFPAHLPNRPFRIDALAPDHGIGVPTRDLVHRFYQNQEQIDGGRNDRFAAVSDAGGLAMGYYDGSALPMWATAREYVLADHFFMGAFGGSFLNHFWLVCACTPEFRDYAGRRTALRSGTTWLQAEDGSPASALLGPPRLRDGAVTPDGDVVNTLQPPYQPSGVPPPADPAQRAYADEHDPNRLPPQHAPTIGDRLSDKGIDWAWYAGGWNAAVADGERDPTQPARVIYADGLGALNFQAHHMPFNYFARFDPRTGAADRAAHLKDATALLRDIDAGRLPPVVFYKPVGPLNEHPGYANVALGDLHIAALIDLLRHSPQWPHMLIIVTYDENGGFWDHVPPPAVDRWGPGTRVPTIIISPFAKRGYVDHTFYDTTSILKLITERFQLEPLPGIRRDVGDLTPALDL
jgi:acid phosphatase